MVRLIAGDTPAFKNEGLLRWTYTLLLLHVISEGVRTSLAEFGLMIPVLRR